MMMRLIDENDNNGDDNDDNNKAITRILNWIEDTPYIIFEGSVCGNLYGHNTINNSKHNTQQCQHM